MTQTRRLNLFTVLLITLLLVTTHTHLQGAGKRRRLRRARVPTMSLTKTDDGYWFHESGQPIMFYQRTTKSQQGKWPRNNYIHPLFDLAGHEMTEDFPADHPHHRGVYWAWHQVFAGDQQLGDGWIASDFMTEVVKARVVQADKDSAALQVEVHWKSPLWIDKNKHPRPFLKETTVIRAHRATNNLRLIDFDITLQALVPGLHLGGSDNTKGYGGFSARIKHPREVAFHGETGRVEPERNGISAGPWIDMVGKYAAGDEISGIAILCHPGYPAGDQPWILRNQKSMQNAAYPGQHAQPVTMEKPWRLKYRLVLHRGETGEVNLPGLHKAFSSEP